MSRSECESSLEFSVSLHCLSLSLSWHICVWKMALKEWDVRREIPAGRPESETKNSVGGSSTPPKHRSSWINISSLLHAEMPFASSHDSSPSLSSLPLSSTVLTFCRATYSRLGIPKISLSIPVYAKHAKLEYTDELELGTSTRLKFCHLLKWDKMCHQAVSQTECICFCVY